MMFFLTNKGNWKALFTYIQVITFLWMLLRQWHSKYMVMEDVEDIEVNRYSPAKGNKKWFKKWDQADIEGIA
jgi:uncharacterized membrane protein